MNIIKSKILFTYLVAFGKTGGIEKVNRTILKCLSSYNNDNVKAEAWSLNDVLVEKKYFSNNKFRGFGGSKFKFVFNMIFHSGTWDKLIVGHINLAIPIRIMKILNPRLKIILMVHGIEVWDKLKYNKRWLLEKADKIISVSNFTKNILVNQSDVNEKKIVVLHNCLDYFFSKELILTKPSYLLERYNISNTTKVLLTVTRINKREGSKGYDIVIKVLKMLSEKNKSIDFKYLLCGKYELDEFNRLKNLINDFNLTSKIILTGFINEDELIDHYRLADIYIMPSIKEGFGMVYIEAAACGLQVIAGNADGSAEALLNGEIGHLINPDNQNEIEIKLKELLKDTIVKSKEISEIAYKEYDFENYKKSLRVIVENV